MKYDSIILDVDGTIWDTTPVVAKAWNKAIAELFPQVPPVTADILKDQFGKTMDVIGRNLFGALSDSDQAILLKRCCVEEHLAIEQNEKDIAYEGVVQTIRELSKKIPLFIVSNCQAGYIELVMKKNGITDCITDFECFGNNGLTKDKNLRLIIERNNLKILFMLEILREIWRRASWQRCHLSGRSMDLDRWKKRILQGRLENFQI